MAPPVRGYGSTNVRTAASSRRSAAFTLVEALISVAIMAAMILALATVFRQSSQLARQARGGSAAFQAARQVFEAIGRDLAGVTREGFLFIRTQELDLSALGGPSGLILYYDEDGNAVRINKGRMDVMVMATAGYQISAADMAKQGNFARVIWAQSERASGNNLAPNDRRHYMGVPQYQAGVASEPKLWAINQVLCRHQTIMLPDHHSSDLSNADYAVVEGAKNRGADFFNMSVADLTRFFGPAMGSGGEVNLPTVSSSFGLFSSHGGEAYNEMMPFRLASKAWRLGRSGGDSPGSEGSGDLTEVQVNPTVPPGFIVDGAIVERLARRSYVRGHERPKIFGPKDYHRIAAFGVAGFQVDFSDGRRAEEDADGKRALLFYPDQLALSSPVYTEVMGPGVRREVPGEEGVFYTTGEKRMYCWNSLSPTSIRDTSLRVAFGGTTYRTRYSSKVWEGDVQVPRTEPADWRKFNLYTQNMFNSRAAYGDKLGDAGWPWPRAIRVRLLIFDASQEQPIDYRFEQIFHMLVQ